MVRAQKASQVALAVKSSPSNAGDLRDKGLTPGSGGSPGEGHGSPLQDPCLENPTYRGAHRVPQSCTYAAGGDVDVIRDGVSSELNEGRGFSHDLFRAPETVPHTLTPNGLS